jgi:hypothetical protein
MIQETEAGAERIAYGGGDTGGTTTLRPILEPDPDLPAAEREKVERTRSWWSGG